MAKFDEPMAGKGKTPMENAYLTFVDEQRKTQVNWCDIPLFRDWVETQFPRIAELQSQLDAKWQSFETAPKNGTEISVWRKDAGVFTAKWTASYGDGDHGEFGMDHNGPECWFTPAGEDLSDDLPTLWQSLPPLPSAAKGETKP